VRQAQCKRQAHMLSKPPRPTKARCTATPSSREDRQAEYVEWKSGERQAEAALYGVIGVVWC